jgi:hypothetical protein
LAANQLIQKKLADMETQVALMTQAEVDPDFGTKGSVGERPLRLIDGANDDEEDEAAD